MCFHSRVALLNLEAVSLKCLQGSQSMMELSVTVKCTQREWSVLFPSYWIMQCSTSQAACFRKPSLLFLGAVEERGKTEKGGKGDKSRTLMLTQSEMACNASALNWKNWPCLERWYKPALWDVSGAKWSLLSKLQQSREAKQIFHE